MNGREWDRGFYIVENKVFKARFSVGLSLTMFLNDMIYVLLHVKHIKLDKDRFILKSRKENPQKLTQLSSRSHSRHFVGKRTAQKDTIIDITSKSQVNSNFPCRWSPASLTFNNYFYLFLYLYIT